MDIVNTETRDYALNMDKSIQKKVLATERDIYKIENKGGNIIMTLNVLNFKGLSECVL